jgi:hypothetical protein
MLGHVRRTTRTDVSLALLMAGISYLAWALSCWTAHHTALALREHVDDRGLPTLVATFIGTFAAWPRLIFDLLGPVWMLAGLYMVIRASRQHRVISWSWLLASTQAIGGLLIGVWAQSAQRLVGGPLTLVRPAGRDPFGIIVGVAVVIWVSTLVWLIGEGFRARGLRVGPDFGDSAKTHAYRK